MRLGPFLRLGIVLSIAWMIFGTTLLMARQYDARLRGNASLQELCLEGNRYINTDGNDYAAGLRECLRTREAADRALSHSRSTMWSMSAQMAALLLIPGWIIGIALYWAVRWILAGQ